MTAAGTEDPATGTQPRSTSQVIIQAGGELPGADVSWERVAAIMELETVTTDGLSYFDAEQKWGLRSFEFWRWFERYRLELRYSGLEFWQRFPSDPRRFDWLKSTMNFAPEYWQDIEQGARAWADGRPEQAVIDDQGRAAWDREYIALRAEFLAAHQSDAMERWNLHAEEITTRISRQTLAARRGEGADALIQLAADAVITANDYPNAQYAPVGLLGSMYSFNSISLMEYDPELEQHFIAALLHSPRADLRAWAEGKARTAMLRDRPFVLKGTTLSGERFDVSELRGKVVLVDIWSNSCGASADAMPRLRAVYDKYRARGFEIAGIWLSSDSAGGKKEEAIEILRSQNVNWPNVIIADEAFKPFADEYAITYAPVTWLLDRNGKLVTTDISGERLEDQIERLLSATPHE